MQDFRGPSVRLRIKWIKKKKILTSKGTMAVKWLSLSLMHLHSSTRFSNPHLSSMWNQEWFSFSSVAEVVLLNSCNAALLHLRHFQTSHLKSRLGYLLPPKGQMSYYMVDYRIETNINALFSVDCEAFFFPQKTRFLSFRIAESFLSFQRWLHGYSKGRGNSSIFIINHNVPNLVYDVNMTPLCSRWIIGLDMAGSLTLSNEYLASQTVTKGREKLGDLRDVRSVRCVSGTICLARKEGKWCRGNWRLRMDAAEGR